MCYTVAESENTLMHVCDSDTRRRTLREATSRRRAVDVVAGCRKYYMSVSVLCVSNADLCSPADGRQQ